MQLPTHPAVVHGCKGLRQVWVSPDVNKPGSFVPLDSNADISELDSAWVLCICIGLGKNFKMRHDQLPEFGMTQTTKHGHVLELTFDI